MQRTLEDSAKVLSRARLRASFVAFVALAGATPAQSQLTINATPPPAAALQTGTGASTERLLPLEVTVNGAKGGTWVLVEKLGALYAPRDAFDEWRLQSIPEALAIKFRGAEYLPLSSVPGYGAKMNFGNQSIELTFSPEAFVATRLTTELIRKPVLSPVLSSFFANYDLNYSATSARDAPTTKQLGMLSELGFSNAWGVLTSSFAGRNLTGDDGAGLPRGWIRLESTYTKDLPGQNQTLRIGDASTRAGMWGRNVYFGGVQWGTNFGLTPGFISQPLPVLSGVSAAPSTVELYVNDVLRQVSTVPAGPFAIDNFPSLTSGGDARLVVRDLLGRETVITQPFFTSSQLLAKGLSDWSVEAGRLRLELGSASSHYGPSFGSGFWRHGLSDLVTFEGRAEATDRLRNAGTGMVVGLPWQILGKAALAASRSQTAGSGRQWLLGMERQTLNSATNLQVQGASAKFRQLGLDDLSPTKLQLAGSFTYTTAKLGHFGVGFASLERYDADHIRTVSANYSIRVGERSNLTLTASRALDGKSGNSVGLILIVPLEKNRIITASAATHSGKQDLNVTATQNQTWEGGLSWRAMAGQQQGRFHNEGGLYYFGRYGSVSSELSATPGLTALRLGAIGGLIFADKHLFATNRLDDSFAVAEVAGYGNVGIGLGSNVLTQTDAAGIALVPRLASYQSNSIRIDPKELPISAEIDSIEQVVVPAWRSGVKVVYPVRTGRAALIKIVFDDGEPAPAGAVARIEGDKQEFYVARRGEAFITGLQPDSRVWLTWKDKQCRFDVKLPPESPDQIVRLGPLTCTGVAR